MLDGANKITAAVEKAYKLNQPAVAITDHGNLHGAIEFYQAAKKIGIKPIIGCELYVAPGSRFDKSRSAARDAGYHLTAIASNLDGYRNLCRLISLAYKEGFYYKPRVDHELLARYSEGIIVLSGCLGSELGEASIADNEAWAKEIIEFYATNYRDRYFIEIQPHQTAEVIKQRQLSIHYAERYGLPIVATTDCHYLNEDDHWAQEVLMCISTQKEITDPTRLRHDGYRLHLKSGDEMLKEFGDEKWAAEAIRNSLLIADRSSLEFDFKTHYMPRFQTDDNMTPAQQMERDARLGLEERFSQFVVAGRKLTDADKNNYRQRLNYEIEMISKTGFAGYFLVVADFIVWAKNNQIPVGPGRGSVSGSLVAYALRITEIDPILYGCIFERFINPDRVALPDIDVDFCIYGREKVLEYVIQKYGADRVAQIATFGTLKAKAAIKDVGRALGVPYAETEKVAQLIPAPRQGFDYSLSESLEMEPRLKEYAKGAGEKLISLALKLEGLTRHASTHAAGVVIGDRPLIDLLPLMVDKDGKDVTQYDMDAVEKIGLVKFDFLGLKTLTVLETAIKLITVSRGIKLDLNFLPLDDKKTFNLLGAGETVGIFQLESTGITDITARLKPTSLQDLSAIVALYRPGPLDAGMVEHYINRKHKREAVTYIHPKMRSALSETYGVMVYQEQVMQLARDLAGYTLSEADLLRKAIGKKIPEEMAKQKSRFIDGCVAGGIKSEQAEEIFTQIETFARYGFNIAHAVAYGLITYQTAYLKAHYPVEYMAALMSHEMSDADKTLKNFNECRRLKISILPPDVNYSEAGFTVADGKIRFGLEAIKGIGAKAVEHLCQLRSSGGAFGSFTDLAARIDSHLINRKTLEGLIKSGALDELVNSRRGAFEAMDRFFALNLDCAKRRASKQRSLFEEFASDHPSLESDYGILIDQNEWPQNLKLAYEREALGFYISGHPLERYSKHLANGGFVTTEKLKSFTNGAKVKIGGLVTTLRLKNTKKGDRYASFTLEDWLGSIEALVWPDTYKSYYELLEKEDPLIFEGRVDANGERSQFIVESITLFDTGRFAGTRSVVVKISGNDKPEERLKELRKLLSNHPGNCPLVLWFENKGQKVQIKLKDEKAADIKVAPSEQLFQAIDKLFGRNVVSA